MSLKPWYKIVTPREGLREGKPLDASEFAVHVDQVREGKAPPDYCNLEAFFAPTLLGTFLACIHQSMILFAPGRGEALKRFLVEDGAGTDQRFWRLAQALSALYPASTEEKRWLDGVLARKKGLGF